MPSEVQILRDGLVSIMEWTSKGANEPHRNIHAAARRVLEAADAADDQPAAALTSKKQGHPEHVCERCHGSNAVWFAPNEIWNVVCGDFDILCPLCFMTLAEAAGFNKDAWRIAPEFHHETEAPTPEQQAIGVVTEYQRGFDDGFRRAAAGTAEDLRDTLEWFYEKWEDGDFHLTNAEEQRILALIPMFPSKRRALKTGADDDPHDALPVEIT